MVLAGVLAGTVLVSPAGAGGAADVAKVACPASRPTVAGRVADDRLTEISGVVASRRFDGVVWVHEDSGSPAALTALSAGGEHLGTYGVRGVTARDWEDIAVAGGSLVVGDIGDNAARRTTVAVHRVPEPTVQPDGRGGEVDATATIDLRYPDGPADAEALLVDPVSGDLVILTKELLGATRVFHAPADELRDGAVVTLSEAGSIDAALVTGADITPGGELVVVRTYGQVLAYRRAAGTPLVDAFRGPPCPLEEIAERQGEAIAVTADGRGYLTISEGVNPAVHHFALTSARAGGWLPGTLAALTDAAVIAVERVRSPG